MTPAERYAAEMRLFEAILDAPPADRQRLIEEKCAGDGSLEHRMKDLLAEHGNTAGFWSESPASLVTRVSPGDLLADRFEILDLLGEGGMGQVWAARDLHSQVDVALKVVRPDLTMNPDASSRFKRELHLARKITHRNVCRVNEIFEDNSAPLPRLFFTMELLSGESLRARLRRAGPIPQPLARSLIGQIVDGLAAAHSAGIVHRDLKPANIMLVPDGGAERAVLMDFGLARMVRPESADADRSHTAPRIGTPDYMAPEQIDGSSVSAATDVYALGLTIYEMMTGEVALKNRGSGGPSSLSSRIRPPKLGEALPAVDSILAGIVHRCLQFDPADRYPDASAVRQAIESGPRKLWMRRGVIAAAVMGLGALVPAGREWLRKTPAVESLPRIGIVPFEPIGETAEQQYLADGLTDQVIAELQRRNFDLPGRGSAYYYKGRSVPLIQIAREMGAKWLVTGTIRAQGDRALVFAQLVDAGGRPGPWSRSYDEHRNRISSVAGMIGAAVAATLAPTATGVSELPAANGEANDLYLRAKYHWNRRDPADSETALTLLEKALKLDPESALIRCGIAEVLASMADLRSRPAEEVLPRARAEAVEAIRLDPGLGHAYAVFANVVVLWEQDGETAAKNFERAISLDPNDVAAYFWYSHLLVKLNRFQECIRMADEAFRRDPLDLRIHFSCITMAYFTRDFARAYDEARKVAARAPDYFLVHELLAEICARLGKKEEARAEAAAALHESRRPGHAMLFAANAYAIMGEYARAESLLQETIRPGRVPSFEAVHVARAYAQMGRVKEALRWLQIAKQRKETGIQTVRIHASYDPIRGDPGFEAFQEELPFGPRPSSAK